MTQLLPLDGITVLEFGTFITGPYAAAMLGDMGADVIKVEPPSGDPMRGWDSNNYSSYFQAWNKSKKSVVLNLRQNADVEAAHALIETADVLIHNFRPGVAERLSLGFATAKAINPRLVYCQISGFGPAGPYAHRPSYNQVVQSLSGLDSLVISPHEPRPVGPNFGDTLTAVYACYGILSALVGRERTGEGALVDSTMIASMLAFLSADVQDLLVNGTTAGPTSRPRFSQSYIVSAQDGRLLTVHLSSPQKFWLGLTSAIEQPDLADDVRFLDWSSRVANYDALQEALIVSFSKKSRDQWLRILEENDVPCAPVNDLAEALSDPQVVHMGLVEAGENGRYGVDAPVSMNGERVTGYMAPKLGEHTEAVLRAIGLGEPVVQGDAHPPGSAVNAPADAVGEGHGG